MKQKFSVIEKSEQTECTLNTTEKA